MVTLPKNCRIAYTSNGVHVKMTYSTELPVGTYDGITVWESYPYTDKNGKTCRGKKYFALEFQVDYQKNLPMLINKTYFEYKKKAMLWNRMQKQQLLQREIDALSNSDFPGSWDIWHIRQGTQLPNPPKQLSIF
jgi:hypothetical protein